MPDKQLIMALSRNDESVKRKLLEDNYERISGIALRFSKNERQAKSLIIEAFDNCLQKFVELKPGDPTTFEEFIEKEFIPEAIQYIKSIRNEYYVASTVNVRNEKEEYNYNLFENNDIIDFNSVNEKILLKSLQALVPSQRLIYNLHVIDGFDFLEISRLLDTSEQTLKSNFEKAKYNFQKNIEKNLTESRNEQTF